MRNSISCLVLFLKSTYMCIVFEVVGSCIDETDKHNSTSDEKSRRCSPLLALYMENQQRNILFSIRICLCFCFQFLCLDLRLTCQQKVRLNLHLCQLHNVCNENRKF